MFDSLIQNVDVNTIIAPEDSFLKKYVEVRGSLLFSAQLGRHLIDSSDILISFAEFS